MHTFPTASQETTQGNDFSLQYSEDNIVFSLCLVQVCNSDNLFKYSKSSLLPLEQTCNQITVIFILRMKKP